MLQGVCPKPLSWFNPKRSGRLKGLQANKLLYSENINEIN